MSLFSSRRREGGRGRRLALGLHQRPATIGRQIAAEIYWVTAPLPKGNRSTLRQIYRKIRRAGRNRSARRRCRCSSNTTRGAGKLALSMYPVGKRIPRRRSGIFHFRGDLEAKGGDVCRDAGLAINQSNLSRHCFSFSTAISNSGRACIGRGREGINYRGIVLRRVFGT